MVKLSQLLGAASALAGAHGIYQDQVGVIDRRASHLGPYRAMKALGPRSLLVATDASVLGAVDLRTGKTEWKKALPTDEVLACAVLADDAAFLLAESVNPGGAVLLRRFAPGDNGALVWETPLPGHLDVQGGGRIFGASGAGRYVLGVTSSGLALVHADTGRVDAAASAALSAALGGAGSTAAGRVLTAHTGRDGKLRVLAAAGDADPTSAGLVVVTVAADGSVGARVPVQLSGKGGKTVDARVDLRKGVGLLSGPNGATSAAVVDARGKRVHFVTLDGSSDGATTATSIGLKAMGSLPGGSGLSFLKEEAEEGVPAPTIAGVASVGVGAGDATLSPSTVARGAAAETPSPFLAVTLSDGSLVALSAGAQEPGAAAAAVDAATGEAASTGSAPVAPLASRLEVAAGLGAIPPVAKGPNGEISEVRLRMPVAVPLPGGGARFVSVAARCAASRIAPATGCRISVASPDAQGVLALPESIVVSSDHGSLMRVGASVYERKGGATPSIPGLRLVLVFEDGHVTVAQPAAAEPAAAEGASKLVWSSPEGAGACVVQALPVDVLTPEAAAAATGRRAAAAAGAAGAASSAPGLAARLAGQVEWLKGWGADTLAAVKRAAADPAAFLAGKAPTSAAGEASGIAPLSLAGAGTERLLITRTLTAGDAGVSGSSAGCPRPQLPTNGKVTGSVSASDFETGAVRWSHRLPLSPAIRSGEWQVGPYSATVVASWDTPTLDAASELMVVEAVSMDVDAPQFSYTAVAVTYLDAASGNVTGNAMYTASGSPAFELIRTPVTAQPEAAPRADGSPAITDDGMPLLTRPRHAYLILHGNEGKEGVLIPGPAPVARALNAAVAGGWSVAGVWYDPTTGAEGLAGRAVQAAPSVRTTGGGDIFMTTVRATPVWSAPLAPAPAAPGAPAPRILALAAGAGATPGMPAQILGDDSLLLKYLNPNLLAVVVGESGAVTSPFERSRNYLRAFAAATHGFDPEAPVTVAVDAGTGKGKGNVRVPRWQPAVAPSADAAATLYLVDAATGRTLHSHRLPGASGPVSLAKAEHWVLATYWNARARRPEIAASALYEGALDTYDLTPWSRKAGGALARAADADGVARVSAHAADAPVVATRSFILPTTVRGLAMTATTAGITPPHILLLTAGDGVMMLDRRLVDPRRPDREPTEAEKAEGLMQYAPVLPLRHAWQLNGNRSVARLQTLVSMPTAFESNTNIAAFGSDEFYIRVAPVKSFDQLEDFNFGILLAAVVGLMAVTVVVKRLHAAKEEKAAWK